MVNPTTKKTIGFLVPIEYKFKGTAVKKAVDTLFKAIWERLSDKDQIELGELFEKEMEVLDW